MTKIVSSTHDAKDFWTADEAFDAVPMLNGRVFQVERIGVNDTTRYVVAAYRDTFSSLGLEPCGYIG